MIEKGGGGSPHFFVVVDKIVDSLEPGVMDVNMVEEVMVKEEEDLIH